MQQYLDLMRDILENGAKKNDRTGVGTLSVFGRQLRFDLETGFPALTTKRLYMKGVIHELLWFLMGSTNINYLRDRGVTIWDEWADEQGPAIASFSFTSPTENCRAICTSAAPTCSWAFRSTSPRIHC